MRIVIDETYCKGCELCLHTCPKKIFQRSGRRNAKGYALPLAKDMEACSGCKTCEWMCPELAVTVEEA